MVLGISQTLLNLSEFHSEETGRDHSKCFVELGLPNRATCILNYFISRKEQLQ